MKLGYTWFDANDPYSNGKPMLGNEAAETLGADILYPTKAEAVADASEYVAEGRFKWKPRIKVFKITAEKVKT